MGKATCCCCSALHHKNAKKLYAHAQYVFKFKILAHNDIVWSKKQDQNGLDQNICDVLKIFLDFGPMHVSNFSI